MSLAGLMVLYVCVCIIPSPQLADGYLRTAIIQQVFKQQQGSKGRLDHLPVHSGTKTQHSSVPFTIKIRSDKTHTALQLLIKGERMFIGSLFSVRFEILTCSLCLALQRNQRKQEKSQHEMFVHRQSKVSSRHSGFIHHSKLVTIYFTKTKELRERE